MLYMRVLFSSARHTYLVPVTSRLLYIEGGFSTQRKYLEPVLKSNYRLKQKSQSDERLSVIDRIVVSAGRYPLSRNAKDPVERQYN